MKKSVKTHLAFVILGFIGFTLLACNNPFLARTSGRTTFTVDFEQNGGTYIDKRTPPKYTKAERQTIAAGGKASNPGLVEMDGHYLGGWYTNPDFSGDAWNFTVEPVTRDIVLYARWEPTGYDVKFDLRGLSAADLTYVPVTEKIADGARATEPQDFGIKNRANGFRGWYKDPECTIRWDFKTDRVTSDTTLYAGWEQRGSGGGGGTPAPEPDPDPTPTPDPDPDPTPDPDPDPTPDPDPDPTPDPDPAPDPDPQPQPIAVYLIEWDTGDSSITPPEEQHLIEGSQIVTPLPVLKNNYAFLGWFTDKEAGHEWNFATDTVGENFVRETEEDGTHILTLYAHWKERDFYTVTFDSKEGSPVPEPQNVPLGGGTVTKPAMPTKPSMEFDAWYSSEIYARANRWDFKTNVLQDMTLYARWVDDLPGFSWVPGGNLDGFYMGETEVTQAEYSAVMDGYNPTSSQHKTGGTYPVEGSWYEAVEYCNARSVQEGLVPVYTISGRDPATGYPVLTATVEMNPSANGYRLPTDAEWEFGALGGGYTPETTKYPGSDNVDEVAWYNTNSNQPQPVRQLKPNSLGLYDLSGNLCEWCWDPVGSTDRRRRGGSWSHAASSVIVKRKDQFRMTDPDPKSFWTIGFRVGRSLPY